MIFSSRYDSLPCIRTTCQWCTKTYLSTQVSHVSCGAELLAYSIYFILHFFFVFASTAPQDMALPVFTAPATVTGSLATPISPPQARPLSPGGPTLAAAAMSSPPP